MIYDNHDDLELRYPSQIYEAFFDNKTNLMVTKSLGRILTFEKSVRYWMKKKLVKLQEDAALVITGSLECN